MNAPFGLALIVVFLVLGICCGSSVLINDCFTTYLMGPQYLQEITQGRRDRFVGLTLDQITNLLGPPNRICTEHTWIEKYLDRPFH